MRTHQARYAHACYEHVEHSSKSSQRSMTYVWKCMGTHSSVAWRMCGSAWERKANDVILLSHPTPPHPTPPPPLLTVASWFLQMQRNVISPTPPHPTPPPRTVTCLAQHRSKTSVKFNNSYRAANQPIAKNNPAAWRPVTCSMSFWDRWPYHNYLESSTWKASFEKLFWKVWTFSGCCTSRLLFCLPSASRESCAVASGRPWNQELQGICTCVDPVVIFDVLLCEIAQWDVMLCCAAFCSVTACSSAVCCIWYEICAALCGCGFQSGACWKML